MDKAILKTLMYADLFNYPLKAWEIHKWLIEKKATLRQVEKTLNKMSKKAVIKYQKDFYFQTKSKNKSNLRIKKEVISRNYLKQIKIISQLFKIIPWVKLVGISGSLAMENSEKSDDIDLFIITSKNRLWLSRIFLLLLLELIDKRRKRGEKLTEAAGKICINLILDQDSLAFYDKNIYHAHEMLQMKVLWQRDGIYSKFLSDNDWVFKYLPNWTSGAEYEFRIKNSEFRTKKHSLVLTQNSAFDFFEEIVKWLQLRYMGKPEGQEKIETGALFFHPRDYKDKVLSEYLKKTKSLK